MKDLWKPRVRRTEQRYQTDGTVPYKTCRAYRVLIFLGVVVACKFYTPSGSCEHLGTTGGLG